MMAKAQAARKEYTCMDCGNPIPKGHRYWSDFVDNQGEQFNRKQHLNCLDYEAKITAQEKGRTK